MDLLQRWVYRTGCGTLSSSVLVSNPEVWRLFAGMTSSVPFGMVIRHTVRLLIAKSGAMSSPALK